MIESGRNPTFDAKMLKLDERRVSIISAKRFMRTAEKDVDAVSAGSAVIANSHEQVLLTKYSAEITRLELCPHIRESVVQNLGNQRDVINRIPINYERAPITANAASDDKKGAFNSDLMEGQLPFSEVRSSRTAKDSLKREIATEKSISAEIEMREDVFIDTTSAHKIQSLLQDQKDLSAQDLDREQKTKHELVAELSELTTVLKESTLEINKSIQLQNTQLASICDYAVENKDEIESQKKKMEESSKHMGMSMWTTIWLIVWIMGLFAFTYAVIRLLPAPRPYICPAAAPTIANMETVNLPTSAVSTGSGYSPTLPQSLAAGKLPRVGDSDDDKDVNIDFSGRSIHHNLDSIDVITTAKEQSQPAFASEFSIEESTTTTTTTTTTNIGAATTAATTISSTGNVDSVIPNEYTKGATDGEGNVGDNVAVNGEEFMESPTLFSTKSETSSTTTDGINNNDENNSNNNKDRSHHDDDANDEYDSHLENSVTAASRKRELDRYPTPIDDYSAGEPLVFSNENTYADIDTDIDDVNAANGGSLLILTTGESDVAKVDAREPQLLQEIPEGEMKGAERKSQQVMDSFDHFNHHDKGKRNPVVDSIATDVDDTIRQQHIENMSPQIEVDVNANSILMPVSEGKVQEVADMHKNVPTDTHKEMYDTTATEYREFTFRQRQPPHQPQEREREETVGNGGF